MKIEVYELNSITCENVQSGNDVLNLVSDCSEDLSMFSYEETNLLYDYLTEREVVRARLLLDRVGAKDFHETVLMIAKCIDTGKFLGFCICSPFIHSGTYEKLDGASITLIAVCKESRRNGVFSKLMENVKNKYSNVTLTCSPKLVELYLKYGFKVEGYFQTHICMTYGTALENGCLVSVDDEVVMGTTSVINSYKKLVAKHGKSAMDSAQRSWMSDFSNDEKIAKNYFHKHNLQDA